MIKMDLIALSNQEMEKAKAGAMKIDHNGRSCGCACVNDYIDSNGVWQGEHTIDNGEANYDADGQDGWGAWSPSMWHMRKPPGPKIPL